MEMHELSDLEAVLGHQFVQRVLLEQALTHGSIRHEQQIGDSPDSVPTIADNERLEFLGDAVVGMVVAEQLYRRYPDLHEGELTRLRAALVSRRHLGLVGTALDLGSYLRLGIAEERNGGRKKVVLLANCMEALIGAVYLEGGLRAATAFVERAVTEPYLDALRAEMRENRAIGDYKTALQELLQARRGGQPEYVLRAESGPDHRKRFLVEVRAHGSRARGEGTNKKRAEQEAARALFEELTGRTKNLAFIELEDETSETDAGRPAPIAQTLRAAETPGATRSSNIDRQTSRSRVVGQRVAVAMPALLEVTHGRRDLPSQRGKKIRGTYKPGARQAEETP